MVFHRPAIASEVEAAPIDPALRAKIVQLMDITNAEELGKQVSSGLINRMLATMQQLSPGLDDQGLEVVAEVTNELFLKNYDTLFDQMIPLYAEYYTESDIEALIDFYQTPIGQKVLAVNPALTQASVELSVQWAQNLIPQLQMRIQERLR
jgi:hypothetical protein